MKFLEVFFFWSLVCVSFVKTDPIEEVFYRSDTFDDISPSKEFVPITKSCDDASVTQWKSDFHECFMKKKYDDGGRDIESIVDRILDHAQACVEASGQGCRPDYEGFKSILGKVLEQMKDYSSMYLDEIYSGRDKIKDLKCVEDTLTLDVYDRCFSGIPDAFQKTDSEFQDEVKNGIRCTNRDNVECSKKARSILNRTVRTIFGMEQPLEEEAMVEKPKPAPPKKWYDYVLEPLESAWNAIKNFFSNLFG